MTKSTYSTLILKFFMFLVEILFKTLKLKKILDLLFLSFYREGSVIADISLTFNEPVGESEVESLLQDAINDGSLGTLKVDTFSVGSTISGVYKLSTTVIWIVPNENWVCDLLICTKEELHMWWKPSEATLLTLSSCDKHLCDILVQWVYTENII